MKIVLNVIKISSKSGLKVRSEATENHYRQVKSSSLQFEYFFKKSQTLKVSLLVNRFGMKCPITRADSKRCQLPAITLMFKNSIKVFAFPCVITSARTSTLLYVKIIEMSES